MKKHVNVNISTLVKYVDATWNINIWCAAAWYLQRNLFNRNCEYSSLQRWPTSNGGVQTLNWQPWQKPWTRLYLAGESYHLPTTAPTWAVRRQGSGCLPSCPAGPGERRTPTPPTGFSSTLTLKGTRPRRGTRPWRGTHPAAQRRERNVKAECEFTLTTFTHGKHKENSRNPAGTQ